MKVSSERNKEKGKSTDNHKKVFVSDQSNLCKNKENIYYYMSQILLRECLNVRTVPTYKMHNIGTVPMFKMHNIGTPKIYDICFELEFGLYKGE